MLFHEQIDASRRNIRPANLRQRHRSGRRGKRTRRRLSAIDRETGVAEPSLPFLLQRGPRLQGVPRVALLRRIRGPRRSRRPAVHATRFCLCRNLLIYLLPEAQARLVSLLHFALREGGLLLVGDAETIGTTDGRFAGISKSQRIYRRLAGRRDFPVGTANGSDPVQPPASRQAAYAELCRRAALNDYGPATVLINAKLECLHFQGPTDRYLKFPRGRPGKLIANAREDVRAKLRLAVEAALHDAGAASSAQAGPTHKRSPRHFGSSSSRRHVKMSACFW